MFISNFCKFFDINNYSKFKDKIIYKVYDEIPEGLKKINQNDNSILSIGSGIAGLELIINKNFSNKKYYFIERNYISKKVRYGWGGLENTEAYNNLILQKKFLINNGMNDNQINIFDYDKDSFPIIKFDLIIIKQTIHFFPLKEIPRLIKYCQNALNNNGKLMIFSINEKRTQIPTFSKMGKKLNQSLKKDFLIKRKILKNNKYIKNQIFDFNVKIKKTKNISKKKLFFILKLINFPKPAIDNEKKKIETKKISI